jgi:hypothetical protein
MLQDINLWAVLVAAIAAFVLGGLWYSPKLLGKVWIREAGMNEETCKKRHSALVFVTAFLLTLFAAFIFAVFLGPQPTLGVAIGGGVAAGLCWVATSFGINYLFAGRSWKLFLIDGGYHTVQFILYGIVLGLWH